MVFGSSPVFMRGPVDSSGQSGHNAEDMLTRFCLYGFLKNQQYYEPFLLLALLNKGLSLTQIGLLVGFRALCVNLLEVPSGAVADVLGRRRSMVASMLAYVASFAVFATGDSLPAMFGAMALFAGGEVFRTGTHKAIIFAWLTHEDRADEKTHIYGLTRSWSKLGSALSAIVAGALVFILQDYNIIFWACLVPYAINVVNLASYPAWLDGPRHPEPIQQILRTLGSAISVCWRRRNLRRVLVESMAFEGLYKSSKDYIQPVIRLAVIAIPVATWMSDAQRSAVAISVVAVFVNLCSSFASRRAGKLTDRAGSDQRAGRWLWAADLTAFAIMGMGIAFGVPLIIVVAFVALAIVQNLWKPILVSRCATLCDADHTATVLSVNSQACSLFVVVAAPLLGWSIDTIGAIVRDTGAITWWTFAPLAAIGLVVSLAMVAWRQPHQPEGACVAGEPGVA
jgi:MFS family permease